MDSNAASTSPSSLPRPNSDVISSSRKSSEEISDSVSSYQDVHRPAEKFIFYDLRPSARTKPAIVTWYDIDDSGDYDPAQEGRIGKENAKKQLVPFRRTAEGDVPLRDGDLEGNVTLQLSLLAARQRGASLVVCLCLKSIEGRALMKLIPDNWPGEYHNTLSDDYVAQQVREVNEMAKSNPATSFKKYALRNVGLSPRAVTPTGACIRDPAGLEEDLANHPVARGCYACRYLGLRCPLIEDDSTWPCHVCIEDDVPCTLLTPALQKTTCEQCKRKHVSCSYSTKGSDPNKACTNCVWTRTECIAAPVRHRISLNKDYNQTTKSGVKPRKYVTCTECRTDKLACNLKKKTDDPPCKSCIQRGIECTFLAIPQKPKQATRKKTKPKDQAIQTTEHHTQDKIPNTAKTITTSLCHPISFMIPEPENCHWCTNPSYGILGLGIKQVLVEPTADNLSYIELQDGHASSGSQASRMCSPCTMLRIAMIACQEHEMRVLDGITMRNTVQNGRVVRSDDMDLDDINVDELFERLISGTLQPQDQFCHFCPSPALFQCCTPQESDMWGDRLDQASDEAVGCGLLLCETCAGVLRDEGDLDAIVEGMEGNEDEELWPMGKRADAELLLKDGLLVRNVFAGVDDGHHLDMEMEMDG